MDPKQATILQLIPAIRMLLSPQSLKSGSFVPLEQLTETDPEQISVKLGRAISVFTGDPDTILDEVMKTRSEIGEYLYLENLGILGLSTNKSKIEQQLATVRKASRGGDLRRRSQCGADGHQHKKG